jgi:c(7)-type cytochrome triheme protein
MKKFFALSFVLFMVVGLLALGRTPGIAETKVKPGTSVHVYDDPSFADEHGKVEFSHDKHKELFGEEKLNCKVCHMTKPPLFSMKKLKEGEVRKAVTMEEMAEGKACGGCHNGKTEINGHVAVDAQLEENCSHCHIKE